MKIVQSEHTLACVRPSDKKDDLLMCVDCGTFAFAFVFGGAFGGVSYGSLGIPLWVRSIAQAASGSHPSSLVCDVRAIFVYRFDPSCPLSPCLFGVWQRLTCCGEAAWRVWPPLPGRGRWRDSRGDPTVGTASGPRLSERRSGCPRGSFFRSRCLATAPLLSRALQP